ncbi:MAG: hypothetical protein JO202_13200 [Ktedonobacteraceae bacterium]|nr:hypothetical protein [Ktedonobacteraceae bacterium]
MSKDTYSLSDVSTPDGRYESPARELFTGREEEIALFRLLREQCSPERACPIVNFIAPAGSGKRMLIDYLRKKECEQPPIPQICVDFSHTNAPKDDLLPILVKIRNKLRERTDENNRHLKFPRFDFAAPLVLARLEGGESGSYQRLHNKELEDVLKKEEPRLDEWVESVRDLGNIVPLAPLVAVAASQVTRIEPLNKFRRWLEEKHIWDWYKDEERSCLLGLPSEPEIKQIIRCIFEKSEPDDNERRVIVEQILPEALLADLRESFADKSNSRIWPNARFAALFFYGFDALLGDAADVGIRLLKILTLTERGTYKEGNPLLLVVASQRPIIANHEREVGQSAAHMSSFADVAHAVYTTWYNEFTLHRANPYLKHLILPCMLHDFDKQNTLLFLRRFGRYYNTTTFENDPGLCDNIYEATKGHPFFLSLVATAINRTWPNAREGQVDIDLRNLTKENLTVDGRNVAASMLRIFLDQLSGLDRRELIWIAFPREVDKSILKHTLLADELEANEILDSYRQLPFVRKHRQRLVLHPLARDLLLQELPPTPENQNYYRIHERLRQYFKELYTLHPDNEEVKVEEAYHALAAGDPQPAIDLGCSVYKQNHALWRQLMDAVAQAPVGSAEARSGAFEQQAKQALSRAQQGDSQQQKLRDSITAIVLYRWILTTPMPNKQDMARLWDRLGSAYTCLPDGDVQDASFAKDKAIQIKDQIIRTQEEPPPPPPPDPPREPISPVASPPRTRLQDKLHSILSPLHRIVGAGWVKVLLVVALFAIAVAVLIGPLANIFSHPQLPPSKFISQKQSLYLPDNRGIGETPVASGSEEVGVSDGSVVFDINSRTDAADKISAAQEFRHNHIDDELHGNGAVQLWKNALKQEPDDAEAQIYLENQRMAGQCVYFVVATDLSGDIVPKSLAISSVF